MAANGWSVSDAVTGGLIHSAGQWSRREAMPDEWSGAGRSVTFFGTYLSAHSGTKGPSETVAHALAQRGYRVRLVSGRRRVALRALESLWEARAGRMDLAVLDVFSTRVLRLSSWIAHVLASRGIPYLAVLHGGALLERYGSIRSVLVPILGQAAKVITPSLYLQDGLRKRGHRVEYLPNPLDLSRFPFLERSAPRRVVRLLWVRAFAEIYRPQWAVEVVSHLRARGMEANLTMVGPDQGMRATTEARAADLGVSQRIRMVGPVPNTVLHEYYHSHDYLLNTTRFESFGMAIAESAATGLPVISAAVGEMGYLWADGEGVLLVPGESSAEFADIIFRIHRDEPDGEWYRRVSSKGRERAVGFDLARIVPRWVTLIDSVVRRDG